jgi:hypothetical protein
VTDALTGNLVNLSPDYDVIIDLDNETNHLQLGRHSAIGQFIVSAANPGITGSGGLAVTTLSGTAGLVTL